jgi:hypothetical protein
MAALEMPGNLPEAAAENSAEAAVHDGCRANVMMLFSDIDPEYLESLCTEHNFNSIMVIAAILDKQDDGVGYPRERAAKKQKLRTAQEEIEDILNSAVHAGLSRESAYKDMARSLLSQDFPTALMPMIMSALSRHRGSLFRAYRYMV